MKSKKYNNDITATVIGKGIRLESALLSGQGIIRIDGEYCGDISVDGELMLEQSGNINGNIDVKIAYISGTVTGNVKCSDLLHIMSTGKITGDIECEAMLVDEGAVFIGYSKMNDRKPEPVHTLNTLGLDE